MKETTELLCLKDGYLRECGAKIIEAPAPGKIVLDKTVFYPQGGGQPSDRGKIFVETDSANGGSKKEFIVREARKEGGKVIHFLEGTETEDAGLQRGEEVTCVVDWQRRYALMRMHTAAHVLGSLMYRQGWLITGNQLGEEESRFDFSMQEFDRNKFGEVVQQANAELAKAIELKIYELPREEALKIPEVVKLAGALPPTIPVLRIVEIPGVDLQADGGTHVRNTAEVGSASISRLENKGAKNKRVYFKLAAPK